MSIEIYTDGSCAPNPGTMGCGFIAKANGKIIKKYSSPGGQGTNNLAELYAINCALIWAIQNRYMDVRIYTDSNCCRNWTTGKWRARAEHLLEIIKEIKRNIKKLAYYTITTIPREQNTEADELAKCQNY